MSRDASPRIPTSADGIGAGFPVFHHCWLGSSRLSLSKIENSPYKYRVHQGSNYECTVFVSRRLVRYYFQSLHELILKAELDEKSRLGVGFFHFGWSDYFLWASSALKTSR